MEKFFRFLNDRPHDRAFGEAKAPDADGGSRVQIRPTPAAGLMASVVGVDQSVLPATVSIAFLPDPLSQGWGAARHPCDTGHPIPAPNLGRR